MIEHDDLFRRDHSRVNGPGDWRYGGVINHENGAGDDNFRREHRGYWRYTGGVINNENGAGDCFVMFGNHTPPPGAPSVSSGRRNIRRIGRRCRRIPDHLLTPSTMSATSSDDADNTRVASRKRRRSDDEDDEVEAEHGAQGLKRLRYARSSAEEVDDRLNEEEDES